jgi:uncharacterized protein (DUF1810 family)
MPTDRFNLTRFVDAQAPVWPDVQAELARGRKQSHWMWFVFPQLAALGRSSMAQHYGLSGLAEAQAYLSHPVLGPRLEGCCTLLLQVQGRTAEQVFGAVDTLKLRSCLTLFDAAAPGRAIFRQCLQQYFAGEADALTLSLLAQGGGMPTRSGVERA